MDEKRQWARVPASSKTVDLRTSSGRTYQADVNEESCGGIGLFLSDGIELNFEEEVWLDFRDGERAASVRHLSSLADGRCKLGLAWIAAARGTA